MAVEENFVRLNTAIEKRKSLEDNAGLERAISSLLSSLGKANNTMACVTSTLNIF